jgi:hypothetical protein
MFSFLGRLPLGAQSGSTRFDGHCIASLLAHDRETEWTEKKGAG